MNLCTQIATPINIKDSVNDWISKVGLDKSIIQKIESNIDRLDSILPPLKNFVVPSGNKLISQIHVCRSITRRCERRYVSIGINESIYNKYGENEIVKEQLKIPMIYLNRLSDYLFALSRFVGMSLYIHEDIFTRNN
jgi:cob(I)alamin adenosyltransferase